MDISLLQNLQSLLRQAQSLQGQTPQAREMLDAEVKDIRLVTRDQQLSLLLQLQKNMDTPTQPGRADNNALHQRIQLLQQVIKESAPLYLLKLLIGKKSSLLLSPTHVEPGSKFKLQSTDNGLISLPDKQAPNRAQPPEKLLESQRQPLIENLRLHLPAAEKSERSINLLDKLLGVLIKLPPQESQKLLSRVQIQTLDNLVKNILKVQTEGKTASQVLPQLKTAISNSGNFLENKIFQVLKPVINNPQAGIRSNAPLGNTHATSPAPAIPLTVSSSVNRSLNSNTALVSATSPLQPNPPTPKHPQTVSPPAINLSPIKNPPASHSVVTTAQNIEEGFQELHKDNKVILLNLLQSMQAPANTNTQPTNTLLSQSIIALLKNFGLRLPSKSSDVNSHHVKNEIKSLAQNLLSRIQSLQLQNLINRSTEGTNSTQLEIHMRIQDQIYPIMLYFQERLIRIKEEEKEKEKKKDKRKFKRQWIVFMEFELEDSGWFASEISLSDEKLNTRFWAKAQRTRERLLNKLKDLKLDMQAAGLNVEEIQVLPGDIPRARKQFEQHLVDIQT